MLDILPPQSETRETSDTYTHVITIFDKHRVIVGSCDHQWIVQRAVGKGATPRWIAVGYVRTRNGLLSLWHRIHHAETCERWPELERLPEYFQGGSCGRP